MDHLQLLDARLHAARAVRGLFGDQGRASFLRHVERYWREMLSSRSQKGKVRWEVFLAIKWRYPLQRPKRSLPYTRLKQYAVL